MQRRDVNIGVSTINSSNPNRDFCLLYTCTTKKMKKNAIRNPLCPHYNAFLLLSNLAFAAVF